jgi:hypothetical protein
MLQHRDKFAEMILANPDWQVLIGWLVDQLTNHALRKEILKGFPPETVPSDCSELAMAICRHFKTADVSGNVDDLWSLLREHEQRLESFMGQDQFVRDLILVLPLRPAKLRALVRYACSRLGEVDKNGLCVVRRMIAFWPELEGEVLTRIPRNVDLKNVGDDVRSMLMTKPCSG